MSTQPRKPESLREMLRVAKDLLALASKASTAKLADGRPMSEANVREEVVDAIASFLVCAREIRGRDEIFERALWREIMDRADTIAASRGTVGHGQG
jgi:hypothetical protein